MSEKISLDSSELDYNLIERRNRIYRCSNHFGITQYVDTR